MNARGRTYALAGFAVAALWLPIPLPGTDHDPAPAPQPPPAASGAKGDPDLPHCSRTLSPGGRVTIGQAVHRRRRIRTLCLRGGVYRTGDVYLRRRGMTITSVPGERAVWQGRIVVRASRVTLERLTLDGTTAGSHSLPNPTINGSDFTLRDSDVTNRNGICVHPRDGGRVTPLRFLVERNRIHDCGRRPRTNHDHGIYVAAGTGEIRWNAVFENADRGIQLYPAARDVRVSGNTLDGNGEGINFGASAADNVVTDNLITNSRVRWNVEYHDLFGRGNQVTSNCLRASTDDSYFRQRGGIAPGIERYLALEGNVDAPVTYTDRPRHDLRPAFDSEQCAGMGAPDDVTAPAGG